VFEGLICAMRASLMMGIDTALAPELNSPM
jgi:hypothetical protein